MGQTIAEAIWEEGCIKGEAKGELRRAKRVMKELLESRFGALPEQVLSDIESCTDDERLHAASLRIFRLEKLEDFQL